MDEPENFDIVIVGGGLAGGLAGVALADAGFRLAVVDAADPAGLQSDAFDGRTTAISYASARVFRRLGIWPALEDDASPINDILVTDGAARNRFSDGAVSSFALHFDSRDLEPSTPLGWIVENRLLRRAIFDALNAQEGAVLIAPAARERTMFGPGHAEIELSDGGALRAALVIAADGRASSLRALAGIRTNEWRYPQTGIVATIAHEQPHDGVAQEFFLPSGPFAILPMTNDRETGAPRSSLVWTERADAAPAYLTLSGHDFLAEVEKRLGPYLGAAALAGPRWSYPLAFTLAHRQIAPRLALIGDAAHAIHPIAGQGYNLAVKDIAALTDTLIEARDIGLDIGAPASLQDYERWRRFDSAALAFGTDMLNRLFSNGIAPLKTARRLGLGAVNRAAPLSRFFMRQAGADLGTLPRLMAPEN